MTESVLGRSVPGHFPQAVGAEIKKQAQLDRANRLGFGASHERHCGALDGLSSLIATLPIDDQRLVALFAIATGTESFRGGQWAPTQLQMRVLGNAGRQISGVVPGADELLAELVAVGIEDLTTRWANRVRLNEESAQQAMRAVRREVSEVSDGAKQQIKAARVAQRSAEAERDRLKYELRVALARLSEESAAQVKAERQEIARGAGAHDRKRHPDHEHIYHRRSEAGVETFEVGYREDGKPRFKGFKTNLSAALKWRDEHYGLATPDEPPAREPMLVPAVTQAGEGWN